MISSASAGSNRDLVKRFTHKAERNALEALFMVEQEAIQSLHVSLNHSVSHSRLDWWSEELQHLKHGVARHPQTRHLSTAAPLASTPDLCGIISSLRMDIAKVVYLSRSELNEYFQHCSASIFKKAALGGLHSQAVRKIGQLFAISAGSAIREIELLREFANHAHQGRIYTPLTGQHDLWRAQPWAFSEAAQLGQQLRDATTQLRLASLSLPVTHRSTLRTALLWSSLATHDAQDISAALPYQYKPKRISGIRHTFRAWRAACAIERHALPSILEKSV